MDSHSIVFLYIHNTELITHEVEQNCNIALKFVCKKNEAIICSMHHLSFHKHLYMNKEWFKGCGLLL